MQEIYRMLFPISVAMPMHMITTRKVDTFAPLIFTMEDLKEQLTPMVNGKLL